MSKDDLKKIAQDAAEFDNVSPEEAFQSLTEGMSKMRDLRMMMFETLAAVQDEFPMPLQGKRLLFREWFDIDYDEWISS